MAEVPHRTQTGLNAAHPPFYASESDPTTTLGAYRGWIKPSTGATKIRNAANTAWLDVKVTGLSVDDLTDVDTSTAAPTDGQALIWDDADEEWVPGTVSGGGGSSASGAWLPVRVLASSSVTIASPGATFDGVTITSGDLNKRVLLTNQAAPATNGIYDWNGAAVPMTRSTDADTAGDFSIGKLVGIAEGDVYFGQIWSLYTNVATLGTSAISFAESLAAGNISDLYDVDLTGLADGDILIWNDGDGLWEPGSSSGAPAASETVAGIAEIATQAEVNTGTDDLHIVTPLKHKTNMDLHINDTSAAHAASAISYAGGTGMSATDVEAAVDELATEKANASDLTAHTGDTTDAHDASAISILDTANQYTATDAEGALAEVLDGLQAHEADATDAHDATAISFAPAGSIASTNVQAAIEEAASEAGGGGSAHTIKDEGSALTQRANLNFVGAGVTVTDDAGNSETEVTIPGGSGGSGNIAGAYDIEDASGYTDAGMGDEFNTDTLDAQWTVVAGTTTPAAGTVDPYSNPAAHIYDLTTRTQGMLVQPRVNATEDRFQIRQADALTNNESVVLSVSLPDGLLTVDNTFVVAMAISTSTTFDGTDFRAIWARLGTATSFKIGRYLNPSTITERQFGSPILASRRLYLRITRRNTNDYWYMWSLDGTNWGYIHHETGISATFTHLWLYSRHQTSVSLQPIIAFNWLRHVAHSANDLDLW